MKTVLGAIALTAATQGALAQAPDAYLDDRSAPQALVRSLYNAVNRKEYARAFSYFAEPPADSLDAYADGYADTEHVSLVTGTATSEGAAGSVYYSIPVAIRARASDGEERVFAGCYTLRIADPQIQGAPFEPLHIAEAALQPAEGEPAEALPAQCGEGQPVDTEDAALADAQALFDERYARSCTPPEDEESAPERYTIAFNYAYDPADAPKREVELFRFLCDRGAYNAVHVYLLADEAGTVAPVEFATPELDVQYRDGDDSAVEDIRIVGYRSEDRLVNSQYDAETLTLTTHDKWRGVGDAFSSGTWIFRSGAFTLVKYQADASFDGETDPTLLLDYHTGP